MCALFSTVSCLQGVVGYGVNLVFTAMGWDLHRTFGWELSQGFAGGHGTASAIGGILQDFQLDYWSTAQSVGVTMATVGLLGGMLIGIWMIKRANDRKEIAGFDAGVIPETTAGESSPIQNSRGPLGGDVPELLGGPCHGTPGHYPSGLRHCLLGARHAG